MNNTLYTTWIQAAKQCHIAHMTALYEPNQHNKQVLSLVIERANVARTAYLKSLKQNNTRLAA